MNSNTKMILIGVGVGWLARGIFMLVTGKKGLIQQ